MMAGEWWAKDLAQVARNMSHNLFADYSSASTINGKLGDLFNCSGNQIIGCMSMHVGTIPSFSLNKLLQLMDL